MWDIDSWLNSSKAYEDYSGADSYDYDDEDEDEDDYCDEHDEQLKLDEKR